MPHKLWAIIEKKTGAVKSAYGSCFAGQAGSDQPLRHVRHVPRGPRSQGARGIMPSCKNSIIAYFTREHLQQTTVLFHLNCLSVADPLSLSFRLSTCMLDEYVAVPAGVCA